MPRFSQEKGGASHRVAHGEKVRITGNIQMRGNPEHVLSETFPGIPVEIGIAFSVTAKVERVHGTSSVPELLDERFPQAPMKSGGVGQ